MVYVYTIKEKIFLEKKNLEMEDPLTHNKGVEFVVSQKYISWIGPFSPIQKKTVRAYSLITGEPIPVSIWTSEMKVEADAAKKSAKGTWKLFMFPIVFLSLIAILSVYRVIANKIEDHGKELQQEYLSNPKVGDILVATVSGRVKEAGVPNNPYYTLFKVVRLNEDTVVVVGNSQVEPVLKTYGVDESSIADQFNLGDSTFGKEELKFRRILFDQASLIPFIEAGEKSDYDLIRILYRKRIK